MSDTSIFVAGNWSTFENQVYEISLVRYSITNGDTTNNLSLKYEVNLSIKDSTANNYVVEWRYKNLKSKNKPDRINKRLHELGKNVPILVKTDDTGQFLEVLNWHQVKENMNKEIGKAKKEYAKYPKAQVAFEDKNNNYNSKTNIEANGIDDVLQFLFFHGIHYKQGKETSLNDTANIVLRNHAGANGILVLKEINEIEDYATLQYHYIKAALPPLAAYTKDSPITNKFDILDENYALANSETKILTKINGSTGWILESIEESCIKYQNTTTIEKRIIKNKNHIEPRFDAFIR